ncbi:hypothetical protein FNF27_04138 [Cafeteria roenbergensis]|uniref:Ribosomal protein eL8/eL30/eS12/Gadd45 domain-containing protein n=1 Tax=Cafeteria roenbergensis TaxID=33653 RepID=A0A5A8D5X0_CAFRO|nr:hypothetical protein FNF28_07708 [Cafeteria roenbergensis]KAA0151258.1 hypothetical protein FNF29_04733 [Cafeteria roenbergensis]KAA0160164.1 hypothetical protein FNF31_04474 [Cafeteria roenbergensis]KAA0174346.1 hypothetical protein FNF27_04138 [Cafeteria roenbergensis]|eukprot:KAA0151258.1 hypothetical protein FNF29_04733 [Cafeteria roenbergensis]
MAGRRVAPTSFQSAALTVTAADSHRVLLPGGTVVARMPSKKSKKSQESINSRIQLVIKSGRYAMGYKQTLKALRTGDAKLVIISNNCPPLRRSELEYYAMLSKSGVHQFAGDNNLLGTACKKLYRCSVMTVMDAGDSDILETIKA